MYVAVAIGGLIGGYLPSLIFNGESMFYWSILGIAIGGFIGLYAGYKIYQNTDF